MNSQGAASIGLLAALLVFGSATGCRKGTKLATGYVGTVQETGKVKVDTGPGAAPGTVNVQWWDTNRPQGNVVATVKSVGERRYRIALPHCTFEVEMQSEPNGHTGQLAAAPQQICTIHIDHFSGGLPTYGSVNIDRATGALKIVLNSNNNQLSPHVTWSLVYDARPE